MYRLIARPRTHWGDISCTVAFSVASDHNQHSPPNTSAAAVSGIDRDSPVTMPATPKAAIDSGTIAPPSRPRPWRRVKAPISAPTPIAPSRKP